MRFVLDTNVVSEMMKISPAPTVLAWIRDRRPADLFLTTVTVAEVEFGLKILPQAKGANGSKSAFRNFWPWVLWSGS